MVEPQTAVLTNVYDPAEAHTYVCSWVELIVHFIFEDTTVDEYTTAGGLVNCL